MNQHRFSFRLTALICVIVLLLGLYSYTLIDIQVTQAAQVGSLPSDAYTYLTRVKAARGEILDRNGNVLIGNRASFNLALVNYVLYSSDNPNGYLRGIVDLCAQYGLAYNDHLPVTDKKPYEYRKDDFSGIYNGYFEDFLAERGWDSDITAPQLIRRLRERYNIPDDWTEAEARSVISIRYELDLRYCTNLPTYVLVEDVDAISLAALKELNVPGMSVETSCVREYHTNYAAHILGRIADMTPAQYEKYKEYDYAMDAQVGQEGLELAFELDLHGTDGLRQTTVSSDGTVLEEFYITKPVAGSNVELSIDINLQSVAEAALEDMILGLREHGVGAKQQGKDAEGGAVVVMSIKTGEVLSCASYPTFDISTYSENFNALSAGEFAPLYTRALLAPYPPGSIFKMVTCVAAIDSGAITSNYQVYDEGIYQRFADAGYFPRCMLYTTQKASHGLLNMRQAISVSCNYYFYEVGWLAGIDAIDKVAKSFGLGESTGGELIEATGHRSNPDVKDALYTGDYSVWFGGDTVSTAIGQSENRYTPLQLCSYICTLANRGTRYKTTFLRRVISADYQELLQQNRPTVLSQLEISDDAYAAYTEGMRLAVTNGTCTSVFGNYPVAVCAKTGTAEHGSGGSDNASFVLFAPMEDPEIAIMVYVEKGAQGGNLGNVAKAILDAYFSETGRVDTVPVENSIH